MSRDKGVLAPEGPLPLAPNHPGVFSPSKAEILTEHPRGEAGAGPESRDRLG